jgi:hypothetical protein
MVRAAFYAISPLMASPVDSRPLVSDYAVYVCILTAICPTLLFVEEFKKPSCARRNA